MRASRNESEEEVNERLAAMAPKFVWLLRDFHLELVDEEGNPISAKQYLENILNMKLQGARNPAKFQEVREMLLNIFLERDCLTMPRPALKESELESLAERDFESLRPKFKKQFEKLKKVALAGCRTKKFEGQEITGYLLLGLLDVLLRELNKGGVPNIKSSWHIVLRNHYENLFEKARSEYTQYRDIQIQNMPYEEGDLLFTLQAAKEKALQVFRAAHIQDDALEQEAFEEFEVFFREECKFTLETNHSASEAFNAALIEKLFKDLLVKLDEGEYAENFEELESDWAGTIRKYEKAARGPGKFIAISEFSRKHQHSAFSRFFHDVVDKYEKRLGLYRIKQDKYDEEIHETNRIIRENEEQKRLINNHVRCKQISYIKNELEIDFRDRGDLKEVLNKIEYEVIKNMWVLIRRDKANDKKKNKGTTKKPKGASCNCSVF